MSTIGKLIETENKLEFAGTGKFWGWEMGSGCEISRIGKYFY
jgi:hypothetical protein